MTVPAWLRFAVAMTSLACFVAAQNGETGEAPNEELQRKLKAIGTPDGERMKGGKEEVIDDEKLTPEQRMARNITSGAGAYCRFVGAVRPAKLMPGQSGTILVTALLQGAAVLPAPAPLEMVSQAQQGIVSLGGMTMRAAEPGRLAAGYLGRPVYENYALLEIPVTMSAEAKLGQKHSINIEFKFDIFDGASAQPIGRFLDHAVAEVEVGLAPDPAVAGGIARPEATPAASIATPIEAPQPAKPANPVTRDAVAGGNPVVPAEVVPQPSVESAHAGSAPSPEAAEGDLPIVPIAIGGGLLLVVVVLLARRK